MSNTARALLAAAGAHAALRLRPKWPWWTRGAPAALLWLPGQTLLAGAFLWMVRQVRRLAAARRRTARADADVLVLAELTALGLAGGMGLGASLEGAAARVEPELQAEVRALLRRARTTGLALALATTPGGARRFYRLLARAVDTGAPVRGAVEAFVDEAADEERARTLEAARRLPVKLLFPLALLILPGFMLLTVGPLLVGSLLRLAI